MYNEEIKKQYLKYIGIANNTFSVYSGIFEKVSRYEEMFGKDLCSFSLEEFEQCVNGIGVISTHGLHSLVSNFKRYVNWVCNNGLSKLEPNAALLSIIPSEVADATPNILKSFVKNPEHLKIVLDSIDEFNETPASFMGVNKIRRVFIWLIYFGVVQGDLEQIKEKDIDINNQRITYKSQYITIDALALQDFKDLLSMKTLMTRKTSKKVIVMIPRIEGELLLRGVTNPVFKTLYNNYGALFNEARKCNPDIIPLTYRRVRLSGIFYNAYCVEIEKGEAPRFADQAKAELELTDNWKRLSKAARAERIYRRSYNMRIDYSNWKKAFNLKGMDLKNNNRF